MKPTLLRILLAFTALVIVLLSVLLVIVVRRGQQTPATSAVQVTAPATGPTGSMPQQPVAQPDPFAGRDAEAVDRVKATPAGASTLGEVIASSAYLDALVVADAEAGRRPAWAAAREQGSRYLVRYQVAWHGIDVGPSWRVDLAEPKRVEPLDAFAEIASHIADPALKPYLGADRQVIEVVTQQQTGRDVRLGTALFLHLRERARRVPATSVHGWLVLPVQLDPPRTATFAARFVWSEGGEPREALWTVDLVANSLRPSNLLANEISLSASKVTADTLAVVSPAELDSERRAPVERDPLRRAQRAVLADPRRHEAVRAAVSPLVAGVEVSRATWSVGPAQQGGDELVTLAWSEAGAGRTLSWRLAADGGVLTPDSTLAILLDASIGAPVDGAPREH
jgi:hypothetical protein